MDVQMERESLLAKPIKIIDGSSFFIRNPWTKPEESILNYIPKFMSDVKLQKNSQFDINQYCLVKAFNTWKRAQIISIITRSKYLDFKLLSLDTPEIIEISIQKNSSLKIQHLPREFEKIPPSVYLCILVNLKPCSYQMDENMMFSYQCSNSWDEAALECLSELILNKEVNVKYFHRPDEQSQGLRFLEVDDIDALKEGTEISVNDFMIAHKFALHGDFYDDDINHTRNQFTQNYFQSSIYLPPLKECPSELKSQKDERKDTICNNVIVEAVDEIADDVSEIFLSDITDNWSKICESFSQKESTKSPANRCDKFHMPPLFRDDTNYAIDRRHENMKKKYSREEKTHALNDSKSNSRKSDRNSMSMRKTKPRSFSTISSFSTDSQRLLPNPTYSSKESKKPGFSSIGDVKEKISGILFLPNELGVDLREQTLIHSLESLIPRVISFRNITGSDDTMINPNQISTVYFSRLKMKLTRNVLVNVAPDKSGLTTSLWLSCFLSDGTSERYLRKYETDLKYSTKPTTVFYLCKNWTCATQACNVLKNFLSNHPYRFNYISLCAGFEDESEITISLLKGVDIVIGTPASVLYAIENNYCSADFIQHLILDDADSLIISYREALNKLSQYFKKAVASQPHDQSCEFAVDNRIFVHIGSHYFSRDIIMNFICFSLGDDYFSSTSWIVSDPIEIFCQHKYPLNISTSSYSIAQRNSFIQIADSIKLHLRNSNVLVFADSPYNSEIVNQRLIQEFNLNSVSITDYLSPADLTIMRQLWKSSNHPNSAHYAFIISDEAVLKLGIKDCAVQIHICLPDSRHSFRNRLACSLNLLMESSELCNSSLSINFFVNQLNENFKMFKFLKLIIYRSAAKNCNDNLRKLHQITAIPKISSNSKNCTKVASICQNLKLFGYCVDQTLNRCCYDKSIVDFSKVNNPDSSLIPICGKLRFKILKVLSPNRFYARILDHRYFHSFSSKDKTQMDNLFCAKKFSCSFINLHSELQLTEIDKTPLKLHQIKEAVLYETLCVYKSSSQIYRCILRDVDKKSNEAFMNIFLVDIAEEKKVKRQELFALPDSLSSIPWQSIEIILTGVKPAKGEIDWSPITHTYVSKNMDGEVVDARIVLSTKHTIWVDRCYIYQNVPGIGKTLKFNLHSQLISSSQAIESLEVISCISKLMQCPLKHLPLFQIHDIFLNLEVGSIHDVGLTEITCLNYIYVNLISSLSVLDKMNSYFDEIVETLKYDADNSVKISESFYIGQHCLSELDKHWYRAVITDFDYKKEKFHVFFVDFGHVAWQPIENLRRLQLETFLKPFGASQIIPFQAIQVDLFGCENVLPQATLNYDVVYDSLVDKKLRIKIVSINDKKYSYMPHVECCGHVYASEDEEGINSLDSTPNILQFSEKFYSLVVRYYLEGWISLDPTFLKNIAPDLKFVGEEEDWINFVDTFVKFKRNEQNFYSIFDELRTKFVTASMDEYFSVSSKSEETDSDNTTSISTAIIKTKNLFEDNFIYSPITYWYQTEDLIKMEIFDRSIHKARIHLTPSTIQFRGIDGEEKEVGWNIQLGQNISVEKSSYELYPIVLIQLSKLEKGVKWDSLCKIMKRPHWLKINMNHLTDDSEDSVEDNPNIDWNRLTGEYSKFSAIHFPDDALKIPKVTPLHEADQLSSDSSSFESVPSELEDNCED